MGMIPKSVERNLRKQGNIYKVIEKSAKGVPEQMAEFVEQNRQIIELLNEHTKAIVSIYKAIDTIAKDQEVKLPKPLVDMEISKK